MIIETLLVTILAPYFIYKLEKFEIRQKEIMDDLAVIKRNLPKRFGDFKD